MEEPVARHGGLRAERLAKLEEENWRLKQLVAEKERDIQALKCIAQGKLVSPPRKQDAVAKLVNGLAMFERRARRVLS